MCSQSKLNSILSKMAEVAKSTFGNTLQAVILYGSYARGDYDDASDIDIMIIADVDREDLFRYKKPIIKATSELGLENDVVITATPYVQYAFGRLPCKNFNLNRRFLLRKNASHRKERIFR